MIAAINYSEDDLATIQKYNELPPPEKTASFWEKTHNDELSDIKERIKTHYIEAQSYTCPYCKQRIEVKNHQTWDAEHIIPKSTHPQFMFTAKNLCVSCHDCNRSKKDKNVLTNKKRKTFPEKSSDYLICHPHFDEYNAHIKIIETASFYFPRTEKGRQTIETCGLLRFLYKFTDYAPLPEEIQKKINALNTQLMEESDPITQTFVLSTIKSIAEEGIKIQQQRGIDHLFQKKSANA